MNEEQPTKRPPWRPREYDLDDLANEILEWSKNPDSINLTQFVSKNDIPPQNISKWCHESTYFREVLSMAKVNLGINRHAKFMEAKLSQIDITRHEYRYDPFYRKDERKEFAYKEKLRKKTDKENAVSDIRSVIQYIDSLNHGKD